MSPRAAEDKAKGITHVEARPDRLAEVAHAYREAVANGSSTPAKDAANALGLSADYVRHLLVKARRTDPPLLGQAPGQGKAGVKTTKAQGSRGRKQP